MASYFEFLHEHFLILFGGFWVLFIAIVVASAIHRRRVGKAIFANPPESPIFLEKWTSGRSLRSLITKVGGARNCLLVAVTRDALFIQPHFPFTLLFLPEVYGLEVAVPRRAIRTVNAATDAFGKKVIVTFSNRAGALEQVELRLRAPDEFTKSLAA